MEDAINIDITISGTRGSGKTVLAEKLLAFLEDQYREHEFLQQRNMVVTVDSFDNTPGEQSTAYREGKIYASTGVTITRDS